MNGEDIQKYLPKYLSEGSQKEMFDDIKKFLANEDSCKVFTTLLAESETIYQGDGIEKFNFYHFEEAKLKTAPGIVLSNTCDIALENERYLPSQLMYSPIINLNRYLELLKNNGISDEKIESHLGSIKKQEITSIFYIPSFGEKVKESIVFLDRITNMKNSEEITNNLLKERLFTLSNFGFYLLLLKISIHFTRIREGVDRKTA